MINKQPPTMEDLVKVMEWRNKTPEALRTSRMITVEMQEKFYKRIQEDPNNIYFSFYGKVDYMCEDLEDGTIPEFIGFAGITNISWENTNGEISIIVNPEFTKKGFGSAILDQMLDYAFNYLNLKNIYGECYECNKNLGFWGKMIKKYEASEAELPWRKYFGGIFYNSIYFNFESWRFLY